MDIRIVRSTLATAALVAMSCAAAAPAGAQGDCTIDGPVSVGVHQPFSLCGPGRTGGFEYRWRGSGLRTTQTACVDVPGLPAGEYQYELVTFLDGVEYGRCVHTVRVGSGNTGSLQCEITGPRTMASGTRVTLCAGSSSTMHIYEWSGPGGDLGTGRCLEVTRPGEYQLTIRNRITGYTRTCSHWIEARGAGWDPGEGDAGTCGIEGPQEIEAGRSVRLCAGFLTGWSYHWTMPNGATIASRCLTTSQPGTYALTMRNASTGAVRRCSWMLRRAGWGGGEDDPEAPVGMNCPRSLGFWRQQCASGGAARVLDAVTMREIARRVDERSRSFHWNDDLDGLCRAVSPPAPMTWRKHLARQQAALLANVAAGELNVSGEFRAVQARGQGGEIGLDPATPVRLGRARTIQELIRMADDLLLARSGGFQTMTRTLSEVNRGMGIGPTCD
jgi:hypothetical protein